MVSPTVSTIYTVTLTDANGCQATGQVSIIVNPNVADGGQIGYDEADCGPFNPDLIENIQEASDTGCDNFGES